MRNRQQGDVSVRIAGNDAQYSVAVGVGDVDCGIETRMYFDTLLMLSFSHTLA